jgi:curved DNA-binding protein CbpA
MQKSSESGEFLFGWFRVLDQLSYYELLGMQPGATDAEVREAFQAFCDVFHPDGHRGRPQEERAAVLAIFRRGTEAHLVLSDPALRAQYDAQVAAHAQPGPPPRISHTARTLPPPGESPDTFRLEEAARSPTSRPFARRADELLHAGNLRHAKLQLVMANHLDPGNGTLEEALRDLEAKLAAAR